MPYKYTLPTMEWMLERIDQRGPDDCWEWQRLRDKDGYGVVRHGGVYRVASRIMYELVNGAIPDGLVVMHGCDNPPCCNPSHLGLGTVAQNNADRAQKGRSGRRKGRLPEADVLSVKYLLAMGLGARSVASTFGLEPRTVRGIRDNILYAHIPWPIGYTSGEGIPPREALTGEGSPP